MAGAELVVRRMALHEPGLSRSAAAPASEYTKSLLIKYEYPYFTSLSHPGRVCEVTYVCVVYVCMSGTYM